MRYLSAEQVLFIHSRLIDATGGSHGIRDIGLLQSAVSRPRATFGGSELYGGLFHEAAALMESIARNHPFLDGNKGTAIVSAGLLLRMNGFRLRASQKEIERFAVGVAVGKLTLGGSVSWFREHTDRKPE